MTKKIIKKMIKHTETFEYDNPSEYLWDQLKTVPVGYTTRGDGQEKVKATKGSIERFLTENRVVINNYYSYKDERGNVNETI